MVIVKIMGGLGNQMFQFAFALNYILQSKQVKFDCSYYKNYHSHNGFELTRVFNIEVHLASKKDIFYFVEKTKESNNANSVYILKSKKYMITEDDEMALNFYEELKNFDDAYFTGYWQHEQYFHEYKRQLKQHFSFPEIQVHEKQNFLLKKKIESTHSVSVHIRRGDYLCSSKHPALSPDYYFTAIKLMQNRFIDLFFYIFSDDINWAKDNIKEKNVVFVNANTGNVSFRDMQLMSLCKHNIIANSSFSWWGAWLNDHEQKIIIAPKQWINEENDFSGLLLENWIKL